MSETVLLVSGRELTRIPRHTWEEHLSHVPQQSGSRLDFMSEAHHRVRYFIVEELPRVGQPLQTDLIAASLELPPALVTTMVDELERNLFFLVRDDQGAVSWAFPVTVEPTPHELVFSTGERLYGA